MTQIAQYVKIFRNFYVIAHSSAIWMASSEFNGDVFHSEGKLLHIIGKCAPRLIHGICIPSSSAPVLLQHSSVQGGADWLVQCIAALPERGGFSHTTPY